MRIERCILRRAAPALLAVGVAWAAWPGLEIRWRFFRALNGWDRAGNSWEHVIGSESLTASPAGASDPPGSCWFGDEHARWLTRNFDTACAYLAGIARSPDDRNRFAALVLVASIARNPRLGWDQPATPDEPRCRSTLSAAARQALFPVGVEAIGDPEARVRLWGVLILQALGDPRGVPALRLASHDPVREVRTQALRSFESRQALLSPYAKVLESRSAAVR